MPIARGFMTKPGFCFALAHFDLFMKNNNERQIQVLTNAIQLIDGWKSTFAPSEWTAFDEETRQGLSWLLAGFAGSPSNRPKIVCLCGSTRFGEAFRRARLSETLAGNIVLTIGCDTKTDKELWRNIGAKERCGIINQLEELHRRKIEISDEVLVLNVDGYIGNSTRAEIEYAQECGKSIRYLSETHQILIPEV